MNYQVANYWALCVWWREDNLLKKNKKEEKESFGVLEKVIEA